jgi:hypothetical protein
VPEPEPFDTRTLYEGARISMTRTGGTVVSVDAHRFEVRWHAIPGSPLIESYRHDSSGAFTVTLQPTPLPDGFGALVEADVPHPHREGDQYVRVYLTRTTDAVWVTADGWRFFDIDLRNARIHHHGAPETEESR